jgi:hypothetical protein
VVHELGQGLGPHARVRHGAKAENSRISRPITSHLPDDRLDRAVERGAVACVDLPRELSAEPLGESWIGVRGFLISCAMRLATSAQAAWRWAPRRAVMSSKVST